MTRIAAVVLAAGRATRYRAAGGGEETKLVAPFRGEPLVRHAVRAALASRAATVVVVTGHARAAVEAAVAALDVVLVHNPDFADGLATSLRQGLASLPARCDGAVVLLGDMPLVGAATIDALLEEAERRPDAQAVVPVSGGERGNPVLLRRTLFDRAATLTGDEGARRLLRDPALQVAELTLDIEAVRLDIDDPAGLAAADGSTA